MKVSTEKIPDSQVLMTIEVESERLEDARGKALRKLAPRAKVPGFRPGKAPPDMVRRYFGDERILDEALDALVPAVYREAVEADESIVPIARAQLVVETTEPLVVKATIPVRPTVDLGAYEAVRVGVQPIVVDEARVEEMLLALRRRHATLEPIDRELGWRDVVRMDVTGTVEETKLVDQQDVEVQLAEDRDVLFPGFEEGLLGHKKGETVEFDVPVPEGFRPEELVGKACRFVVTINETKEEVLPELTDEFTQGIGEGYETVETLRERIRDDIRRFEEDQRDNRYHDEILGELVERATIEYPPVMLEAEVEHLMREHADQLSRGVDMAQYLAALGKTEEQVREELRPIADIRLRRSLVLSQVGEAEHLEVADEEVEAELDRMTASAGQQAAQLRQMFGSADGRGAIRRNLLTRKTLERLVAIATQDAAAAATAEQEPPGKAAGEPAAEDEQKAGK